MKKEYFMDTLMEMVTSWPAFLAAAVGLLAIAMQAYAKVPRRSTSISITGRTAGYWGTDTDTEMAIAEFFVVKYRTQAMVSGHFQTARNLRKQGVPLEVARMILFGERRDRTA
jgi:hypothetical protein